jgi:hypothetical protein
LATIPPEFLGETERYAVIKNIDAPIIHVPKIAVKVRIKSPPMSEPANKMTTPTVPFIAAITPVPAERDFSVRARRSIFLICCAIQITGSEPMTTPRALGHVPVAIKTIATSAARIPNHVAKWEIAGNLFDSPVVSFMDVIV